MKLKLPEVVTVHICIWGDYEINQTCPASRIASVICLRVRNDLFDLIRFVYTVL
jgi:hypothetical protein